VTIFAVLVVSSSSDKFHFFPSQPQQLAMNPNSSGRKSRRNAVISASPTSSQPRAVSVTAILLLALAVHGPLLLMQLPTMSYDAYTHMFFASHYAIGSIPGTRNGSRAFRRQRIRRWRTS